MGTERKTGTLFGSTTGPAGGLFGQSTAQPQQQQQQQNTQGSSLFGGAQQNQGSTLFGASQAQQPQQQQQQQQPQNSIFGTSFQPSATQQQQQPQQQQSQLPPLRQSANAPFATSVINGQRTSHYYPYDGSQQLNPPLGEVSVVNQMGTIAKKWSEDEAECVFQHYFYNQVDPSQAPFYGPGPGDNERKWEEALSKKPGPGAIPVLARGFGDISTRLLTQKNAVAALQKRLHEINNSLNLMKSTHELQTASRIAEARRRHVVFTQRALALAAKTQILRNRGFAMDQSEEELKRKLSELEKKTFSPVLSGRQEEIWARMSGVRERTKVLMEETEKLGRAMDGQNGESLTEEEQKQVDKVSFEYSAGATS